MKKLISSLLMAFEREGFIAIKPIKSQYIILDIPVDGENFHFLIDNNAHY